MVMTNDYRCDIDLDAWWRAVFSERGPAGGNVRATLQAVVRAVDEKGWATVQVVSPFSGLEAQTVRKHLGNAVELGWLSRLPDAPYSDDWRANSYLPRWPDDSTREVAEAVTAMCRIKKQKGQL